MRILVLALITGSAVVAASSITEEKPNTVVSQETAVELPAYVDPIVTGRTISTKEISDWEKQSKLYAECPECVANQPFPED